MSAQAGDVVAVAVMLAFVCERLTEILVGQLLDQTTGLERYKPLTIYFTTVLGVVLASLLRVDILSPWGVTWVYPQAAYVVSGVLIGGGSNLIHDLFGMIPGRT